MWVFWALFIIVLAIISLHIIIPKKYHGPSAWRKITKIPGLKNVPYFGSMFSLLISNEELLPTLKMYTDQFGTIWRFSLAGVFFLVLADLDDIEIILSSRTHITKGEEYDFLIPWLGTGLLTSTGKKWADHRKWLTPAFHFTILEQYVNIMSKSANILVQTIKSFEEGHQVEVNPLIGSCTLDIICETAMGVQVNAQLGGENEYVKTILRISQIIIRRTLSPWLYRDSIFKITPLGREHDRLLKTIHGFTKKVIKERQLAFREKNSVKKIENQHADSEKRKKMSFLDLLIEFSETQNRLTEDEIREEVDTFMFEGHDTTSAAVSWALYELGLHADIQEKAYQEQWEIFQDTTREINFGDLQEMKYLERVIKETLRLFPSVPIITRKVDEDVKIRNYVVPAETQVAIFTYYVHRNPNVYPEPEKFNPDRFLPELLRERHPFSYIPFSAGPRNCIGQKFAMMEEKIILSYIIRNFKFTTVTKPESVKLMGELILRPKENIKIIFSKRNSTKM